MTEIKIETTTIKPRTLTAKWTVEEQHDLHAMHGFEFNRPVWFWRAVQEIAKRMKWGAGGGWYLDGPWGESAIEKELKEALAAEITQEIDNEILEKLKKQQEVMGM